MLYGFSQVPTRDLWLTLVNYAEIFFGFKVFVRLMQQFTRTITASYLTCTFGNRFLIPDGMLWL